MSLLAELGTVDRVALGLLALALLRGLWIGAVREAFSLAAMAAAALAVRLGTTPAGEWLAEQSSLSLGAARLLAGAGLAIAAVLVVGAIGRLVRRGFHASGLAALDRLGGGVIGATEGALVLALLLAMATSLFGPLPPFLVGTRTLAAYDDARTLLFGEVDVAAPPRDWRPGP